jgi:hypothetical protein
MIEFSCTAFAGEGSVEKKDTRKNINGENPLSIADLPTHSEEGVDLTLIRWMLSLTPLERLEVLQESVSSIMRLRGDQAET